MFGVSFSLLKIKKMVVIIITPEMNPAVELENFIFSKKILFKRKIAVFFTNDMKWQCRKRRKYHRLQLVQSEM